MKNLKRVIFTILLGVIIGTTFAFVFDFLQKRRVVQVETKPEYKTQTVTKVIEKEENIDVIDEASKSVFPITVAQRTESFQRNVSTGSLVLYKEDKDNYYFMTNQHVVANGNIFEIQIDGKKHTLNYIGGDKETDIAVLKLSKKDTKKLSVIKIANMKNIRVGQKAIAVGNALGYGLSRTQGIISALNRDVDQRNKNYAYKMIQTDASINPGNSGGALLNSKGEIVGINTIKIASRKVDAVGFAIPIDSAVKLANAIIDNKFLPKTYLGVATTDNYYSYSNEELPQGVLVVKVYNDSPALKAGLKKNDIIIKVDDKYVRKSKTLGYLVRTKKPGDEIVLTVFRDYKEVKIKVKLAQSKSN